jgi:hypothetical protein
MPCQPSRASAIRQRHQNHVYMGSGPNFIHKNHHLKKKKKKKKNKKKNFFFYMLHTTPLFFFFLKKKIAFAYRSL